MTQITVAPTRRADYRRADAAEKKPARSQFAAAQNLDLAAVSRQPPRLCGARPGCRNGGADAPPVAHGDHFHLGEVVVAARDATGLRNPSVWAALERKGLIRSTPPTAVLTALGRGYDTGLRDKILHVADHC